MWVNDTFGSRLAPFYYELKTTPSFLATENRLVKVIYLVILAFLLPALLINLGLLAFIDDEGIRSLVALEMKLSGNYITPTMLNEFYYNKPPLYNWFLLGFFELTGVINEWTARIPTVFFLLCYAATVYYFMKKHFGRYFAFLMALILITCGRILFYESLKGLIDMSYSWVIFTMMMVLYHEYIAQRFVRMFGFGYLLAAIAFLLKGLPTIVFMGATLFGLFVWKKDFKRFFDWRHFMGLGVFALIVGGYYFVYTQYNSLDDLFPQMVKQSTRRTMVEYGWWPTIRHLFTFPFEQIYHFLPWSILVIHLFQKEAFKKIFAHDFLAFCAITFAINIPLYWSSVEVYARYLLMFIPLVYAPLLYLHFQNEAWHKRLVEGIFVGISCVVALGSLAIPFLPNTQESSFLYLKTIFLVGFFGGTVYLLIREKQHRLLLFVLMLLVFRVAFDWFVLPDRYKNDRGTASKLSSIELGLATQNRPLSAVKGIEVEKTNAFYITNARQKIIDTKYQNEDFKPDVLYIFKTDKLPEDKKFNKEFEFICRHNEPKFRVVGTVE